MGTTTLLSLRGKLQMAIGDVKGVYADKYTDAIKNAIRETYPKLHRKLDDMTLVTGNMLPNSHFEDWEDYVLGTSDYPDHYKVSGGVTALADTTYIRGGANSAKATRATTDGYMYVSQAEWPRLLDLMGETVTFKSRVLASTASQAYIEIYTKQADGTAQTKTSSAHSGGGEFELLEKEVALNDDLTDIQFRWKVITTDGSIYFDASRVTGKEVYEHLLPADFQKGEVLEVYIQPSGYSDDICDDLHPRFPSSSRVFDYEIIQKGVSKYLQLPSSTSKRLIRLIGDCPLEIPTADTSTISLDGERINLLVAYAAYLLYEMETDVVSASDVARMERASVKWLGKYRRMLSEFKMSRPPMTLKIGY